MTRQTARRNQHGIEAQIISLMFGVRHQPDLRGRDDARLLAWRYRIGRVVEVCARFDLDKSDKIAPSRHDVDFAMRGAKPPGEDAIALGDQNRRGLCFR